MRTVRTLSSAVDRTPALRRIPVRTLLLALALILAVGGAYTLIDRVLPPAAPATPATDRVEAREDGRTQPAPKPVKADKAPAVAPARVTAVSALLPLAGVLGGAVGLIVVLRRALKRRGHLPAGQRILKVRDVLAMGPKRAIYLIALEHRNLVVGSSGDQLTLLSEYSDDQDEPVLTTAAALRAPGPADRPEPAAPPREEPRFVRAPAPAGPSLDVEIADEVAVPAPGVDPAEAVASRVARPFSFAAVGAAPKTNAHRNRVPEKFRKLLERAADESEGR
jgi:flagellar biogenesis protein FliO